MLNRALLPLLVLTLTLTLAAAESQPTIRDSFADGYRAVTHIETDTRITGVVAAPWQEDSRWAAVTVHYQRYEDDPYQGEASQRIQVGAITRGQVQLKRTALPLRSDRFLRLALAAKSPSATPVTVQLRMRSAPYRVYWEQELSTALEWQVFDHLVPPLIDDSEAVLLVVVRSPGTVDLGSLTIDGLDRDTAVGVQPTGNLVIQASWPLGVTAPWALADAWAAASDPEQRGPTGQPALRMVPAQAGAARGVLHTGVAATGGGPYTIGVWVRPQRAGQRLTLQLGPPEATVYRPPFRHDVVLTEGWQWVSHTVEMPYAADGVLHARIVAHGRDPVWLDGALVAAGAAVPPQAPGRMQLAVAPRARASLYGPDAPLLIDVHAWGEAEGSVRLTGDVVDLRGARRALPAVLVEPGRTTTLTIDDTGLATFGTLSVLLRPEDDGGVAGPAVEVLLHRAPAPRHRERFLADSPFGAHLMAGISPQQLREQAATLRDLGFTWVRGFALTTWANLEPSAGQWTWDDFDAKLDALAAERLLVLGMLGEAPSWATHRPADFRRYSQWMPRDSNQWEAAVCAIVTHAGSRVAAYEVWNEPYWTRALVRDLDEDGAMIMGTPAEYVALHAGARRAAQVVRPDLPILWNANFTGAGDYCRAVAEAGIAEHLDVLAVHQYTPSVPEGLLNAQVAAAREAFAATTMPKIWNTEGGHGPIAAHNAYRTVPPLHRRGAALSSAAFWVRSYVACLELGMVRFFAYATFPEHWWSRGYTLFNVDGRLHPNAIALANLFQHLEGARHVASAHPVPGLRAVLFQHPEGEQVAVLINDGGRQVQLRVPDAAIIRDQFGNRIDPPLTIAAEPIFVSAPAGMDVLAGIAEDGE